MIRSEADIMAEREYARKIKEEKEKKSHDRKARMKELEKKAALLAKKSDIEIEQEAKENALRALAAEKLDKNSDTVKLLTSMSCKAAAYSLRDAQVADKHSREAAEAEYNRRMDIVMEIDRLKDLHRREAEEKVKAKKRVDDRKVIDFQIAERQRMKIIEAEKREQENQAMLALMNKYKEDDEITAARRKVEVEKSKIEVMRANEESIRRKREARDAEKKEMEDILIYQAMKDAELAKREEEEAALEHAKKERQAKLLAQQERAQNNAGKLDELRARRAADEKERRERAKEKEKAMKLKGEMKELVESRIRQAADKKMRESRFKDQEEAEFQAAAKYMADMAAREESERRAKLQASVHNRNEVLKQIQLIEKKRADNLAAKYAEGSNFRQEQIAEESRLKVIRDQMVRDLEAQGVSGKYLAEMKNLNIGKLLRV